MIERHKDGVFLWDVEELTFLINDKSLHYLFYQLNIDNKSYHN